MSGSKENQFKRSEEGLSLGVAEHFIVSQLAMTRSRRLFSGVGKT